MLAAVTFAVTPAVAHAEASASSTSSRTFAGDDREQELLERYSPELMFQRQDTECGKGEPYRPIDPSLVFAREGVVLRGANGAVIDRPTIGDLPPPSEGADWYLDLPGDALQPGCSYERFHDSLGAESVVHGRVAFDPDHPDRLVLQYWFYYVYNDWNDRHESDWEMVQVELPARTIEEAFDVQPLRTAYAQHEGAELSTWTDGSLRVVDGTHPLVFVGVGSHASYYASAHWFGSSAQSGFGCDETLGPSDRERPPVARLDADSPPAWLSFTGRWGQREPSFNNGPTGPVTKTQWDQPVTWMETEGRVGAASLPAAGTMVTDFFCAASRFGSVVMFRLIDDTRTVVLLALVALVGLVVLVRSTRWRPADLDPVLQERSAGQIVRSSLRLVRRHRRTFMPLGTLMVLAGVAAGAAQLLVVRTTEVGDVVEVVDEQSFWASIVVLAVSALVVLPVTALVGVATQLGVRAIDRGETARARDLVRAAAGNPRAIATQVISAVLLIVALASVVLAPIALWLSARWAVVVPAAIDSDRPLSSSTRLTAGHRMRSLLLWGTTAAIVALVPPLVGTLVLLLLGWGFGLVNLVAALVAVVLVPTGAVVAALQYGDLSRRSPQLSI